MSERAVPQLIRIPAGTFAMGATKDDKFASLLERPRHRVTFTNGFDLGRTPVTVKQWSVYAVSQPAGDIVHAAPGTDPQWPMMGLNRTDVAGYLAWLNDATGRVFRLPTEAEWEYAARSGTTGVFHTGDSIRIDQANYLYDEQARRVGPGHPTPVASYPANLWGLHDMLGSVSEWVADDWHGGYAVNSGTAPADGSAWIDDPPATHGVVRGGSWDHLPRLLRCAFRDRLLKTTRLDITGFRVACG